MRLFKFEKKQIEFEILAPNNIIKNISTMYEVLVISVLVEFLCSTSNPDFLTEVKETYQVLLDD